MVTRAGARRFFSYLFFGVVMVIILAVAGEWFVEVARDKGWYQNAGRRWDALVGDITAFVTSSAVLYPATLLGGLVVGLWVDAWLAKSETGKPLKAAPMAPLEKIEPKPKASSPNGEVPMTVPFKAVPLDPPTDQDGFDYPYRKAVMQAQIDLKHGTAEAQAGKKPHRLSIMMAVENKHKKSLRNCHVTLLSLATADGETQGVNKPLYAGKDFELNLRSPKRLVFLTRDISDEITPQPFLLRTKGPGIPLKDSTRYFATLELRCRYPHPTNVVVQIDTDTELKARAVIIHQGLEPEE